MYENLRKRLTKRGFVKVTEDNNKVRYNPQTGERLTEVNPCYRLALGSHDITIQRRSDYDDPIYGINQIININQSGFSKPSINVNIINPQDGSEDYIITLINLLLSQQATPV